ncbi:hypothetical protein BDV41DRAFT_545576, partial [Aspergillus transmontanensis]
MNRAYVGKVSLVLFFQVLTFTLISLSRPRIYGPCLDWASNLSSQITNSIIRIIR